MKKIIMISISMLLTLGLITGCGSKKDDNTNNSNNETEKPTIDENQTVVDDQIFEGLEFLNVGIDNNTIRTIVINNTGVKYEGSKFSIKVMDGAGNVLKELIDEIKTPMETGTTLELETNVDVDLSTAASIEYSIVE